MRNKTIYQMTLSAMLMAVAILIPMFSPVKVIIEPASFTLASHVAIMIAMFISPAVAVAVELGASIGFFMAGFPIVVVLRALAQIVFVVIGSLWLKQKPELMKKPISMIGFAILIGVIHAVCEVAVSMPFYFAGTLTSTILYNVFVLVGIGTLVHSCVDFAIAVLVWKALVKSRSIAAVSCVKEIEFH